MALLWSNTMGRLGFRAHGELDRFYLDVAPLQEAEYTGIPQVTAKLAEHLLGDSSLDPGFYYNRHEIPAALVGHMLSSRTGRLIRWASERYVYKPLVRTPASGRTVGLHTNMKFARRLFPTEGQIVHDLTTVVTPHFHTEETNRYHVEKFYGDLHSNDITFCVSASTAADIRTYYPGLPGEIVVSHLGVDWDHISAEAQTLSGPTEKYILVLGTLEPRKNVIDVLKMIADYPRYTRMYRFIFVGRTGWGDSFDEQIGTLGLHQTVNDGRIMRTGFVSETAKYLLFKNAAAVIYPSAYEGFGLPVAEAISLGVPVVTSTSSSLPEVGQAFADYFVLGDHKSLEGALSSALRRGRLENSAELQDWKTHFSWARCYQTIRDQLLEAAGRRS